MDTVNLPVPLDAATVSVAPNLTIISYVPGLNVDGIVYENLIAPSDTDAVPTLDPFTYTVAVPEDTALPSAVNFALIVIVSPINPLAAETVVTEFVCIPRMLLPSDAE